MQGKLTANGSTKWMQIKGDYAHISGNGTFGGGTVALEQKINGTAYPVRESSGAAVTYATAFDAALTAPAIEVRFTLAGATSPDIDWAIESEFVVESTNQ